MSAEYRLCNGAYTCATYACIALCVTSTIANVAKNNPFSTFGCNYANSIINNIHEWHSNIMPEEILCIDTVRELIEVRDGRKIIRGLDRTV